MSITPIEYCDPLSVFALWAEAFWAQILDSPTDDPVRGRYAYVVVEPYATLVAADGRSLINGAPFAGDPFQAIQHLLDQAPPALPECPVPFGGGAVGFLGYEIGRYLERAPAAHALPKGQPEMAMGFYDAFIAFDRVLQRAWVMGVGERGEAKAARLLKKLQHISPLGEPQTLPPVILEPQISRQDYLDRVAKIIDYIHAGDIFQANFTMRFAADRPEGFDDFAAYARLRKVNPAPFAAFMRMPGMAIASASPERFIRLDRDGTLETRPIKGTRPRHTDELQDQALAQDLLHSAKDQAENLMIVDLLRNDIGRVAVLGSVKVPVLAGLESFASVHHLVSVVQGKLRPALGAVDVLRACFPGGSITGAPKVRAMEIIDELEVCPRGPACGSVLWIGFDGAMDSNIIIRTVIMARGRITAQAGGGIVADSDPVAEWDEMMTKIAPALQALGER